MQAPDFDRKMLALVTQLSHESNMKGLLLSVLDSLLQTLQTREGDAIVEAMVLIRCAIRLIMKLLADPAAQTWVHPSIAMNSRINSIICRAVLIGMLVAHFITGGVQRIHRPTSSDFVPAARTLVETALSEQKLAVVMKDLSWLWRTAYNCAVQGCAEWENSEDQVTDLFEIAREVLSKSQVQTVDNNSSPFSFSRFTVIVLSPVLIQTFIGNSLTHLSLRLRAEV